jgi:hypothetical protein
MKHPYPNVSAAGRYIPYLSRHVLVFKTNIRNESDVQKVALLLNADEKIMQWNVALDDSDKVLRIASHRMQPVDVIGLLTQAGFFCEELPD